MWVVVILPYHYHNVGKKRPMTERKKEETREIMAVVGEPPRCQGGSRCQELRLHHGRDALHDDEDLDSAGHFFILESKVQLGVIKQSKKGRFDIVVSCCA
jgi:hypothetical protein